MGFRISALQCLFNISSLSSVLWHMHGHTNISTLNQFILNVQFQLPALVCIVGESVHEGGSRSNKLSGAGGGRVFRDLDLLAEYMFSNSAYTADSL